MKYCLKRGSVLLWVLLFVVAMATPTMAQVEIDYWIWDISQAPATEQAIEMFEATNDVKVNLMVMGWDEYWDKIPIGIVSGTGPDVYWMSMIEYQVFVENGLILNLQPYLDRDPEAADHMEMMWPVLREAYSYQGDAHGFPRDYDSIALVYNESAVNEAGLVEPMSIDDMWTWDDLLDYARKLTVRADDEVVRWGFNTSSWGQGHWYPIIRSNNGDVFNEDGTEAVLASSETVQATQFLVDLRHVYGVAPVDEPASFGAGSVAMEYTGNWELRNLVQNVSLAFNVAGLPRSPHTGRRSSTIHGLANVINPLGPNVDVAFEFVKFLASQEAQLVFGDTGTIIPSRVDSAMSWFDPDLYPSNRVAFQNALDYGDPHPLTPYLRGQEWQGTVTQYVNDALLGEMTVEEALSTAQDLLNARLAEAIALREAGEESLITQ